MWFVFAFVLTTGALYLLSYENWVQITEEVPFATSTVTEMLLATSAPAVLPVTTAKPASVVQKAPLKTLTPWKETMTTYFYVGEPADASNDFITNTPSYWDEKWEEHFGGADLPTCRNGYLPCGFTPKENPFYFALPYAEYDEAGNLKANNAKIPWYNKDSLPLLKNRWIAVRHNGVTCYGQWQDVGPNGEDDFAYVFGKNTMPKNTFGVHAGLDLSPALWKCLQMTDNDHTQWAFVDASSVPDGPWKDIVTVSGISWGMD